MKTVFWIALITAVILSFMRPAPVAAEMRSVTLGVRMACVSCTYTVRRTLESVPGVTGVRVSRGKQMAMVIFEDLVTDISTIAAATRRIGYETTVLSTAEAGNDTLSTFETSSPGKTGIILDRIKRMLSEREAQQRSAQ